MSPMFPFDAQTNAVALPLCPHKHMHHKNFDAKSHSKNNFDVVEFFLE
jgi:hypothetical protein